MPKKKKGAGPTVGYLSIDGFDPFGQDPQKSLATLTEWLLPSVSYASGRSLDSVREDIRGPTTLPTSRLQGECRFDGDGLACEVVLYEGLLLSLRCFVEILATQLPVPQKGVSTLSVMTGGAKPRARAGASMPREKAVEILEVVLERFWQRPEDPLGIISGDMVDKTRWFRPDFVRPILDVLPTLNAALDAPRRDWTQTMIRSTALFVLAHELGHYVVRAQSDEGTSDAWTNAIRATGFREPDSASDDWAANWAAEFQADLQANTMLMHFGQRAARGEIEAFKHGEDVDAFIATFTMESWTNILFALATVHLIEFYGMARFGAPFPSISHPPAMRRRELLVRTMPPQVVVPLTIYGEMLWAELEVLFSEVLARQMQANRLAAAGRDLDETLEYFASARTRFERNYKQGELLRELNDLQTRR